MDNSQVSREDTEIESVGTSGLEETLVPELSTGEGTSENETEQLLQQLLQGVQDLQQEFSTKMKYDASKERQVDNLYQELQVYREGLHVKILKPVFTDLIAMHDDLGKLLDSFLLDNADSPSSSMYNNLKSFQDTVEEILKRNGVESYSVDGDTYVPGKQRVLRAINTPNEDEDKKIARRIRLGFTYDERILRQELVFLYKFVQDAQ